MPPRWGSDPRYAPASPPYGAYPSRAPYPYGYYRLPPAMPPPPKMERRDPVIMAVGIAATSLGAAAVVTGASVLGAAVDRVDVYCDNGTSVYRCDQRDDERREVAGAILMIAGGVGVAVGIPLWIHGSRKVPAKPDVERAQIVVHPKGAGLRFRF